MNFLNKRNRNNSAGKLDRNKINDLENDKLAEFSLKIMSYFGIWRPRSMTTLWTIRLYDLYSLIMLLHKYYFAITVLINLCQNKDKLIEYVENIVFFTTAFLIAVKMLYLKFRKQELKSFMNLALQHRSLPRNNEEALIYENFQYKERLVQEKFVTL